MQALLLWWNVVDWLLLLWWSNLAPVCAKIARVLIGCPCGSNFRRETSVGIGRKYNGSSRDSDSSSFPVKFKMAGNAKFQESSAPGSKIPDSSQNSEKEKYKMALSTTRDIRNLVDDAFENAFKDFSTEKIKLKETLVKLEKNLRWISNI